MFKALDMDMAFQSTWTSFTKRKVDKRFCVFFFTPEKMCTLGYRRNNYTIEDLGHSFGTPLKTCLGAVVK